MRKDYGHIRKYLEFRYDTSPHDVKSAAGTVSEWDGHVTTDHGLFLHAAPMLNKEYKFDKFHRRFLRYMTGKDVLLAPLSRADLREDIWNRYYKESVSYDSYLRVRDDWQPFDSIHTYYAYRILYINKSGTLLKNSHYKSLTPLHNIYMSETYYLTQFLNIV